MTAPTRICISKANRAPILRLVLREAGEPQPAWFHRSASRLPSGSLQSSQVEYWVVGTTYWSITIMLAAMVLWSAVALLPRDPNVTRVVHEIVGVPLKYFPLLAACEIAGAFGWGFRRSRTLIPKGSRTAFRDDPEHHRSVATLATRLCKKCSASSRGTFPERSEGRKPLAEKGVRGKGRSLCPRLSTQYPGALFALRNRR